jgi:Protein of unknown function (DUF2852)
VVLIEALVALGVLLTVGVGLALLLNTLISKVLEARASRTLAGRIALKEKEVQEHDRYMRQLEQDLHNPALPAYRQEILGGYKTLAQKKDNELRLQLEALKVEKDREEFEEHMRRSER